MLPSSEADVAAAGPAPPYAPASVLRTRLPTAGMTGLQTGRYWELSAPKEGRWAQDPGPVAASYSRASRRTRARVLARTSPLALLTLCETCFADQEPMSNTRGWSLDCGVKRLKEWGVDC